MARECFCIGCITIAASACWISAAGYDDVIVFLGSIVLCVTAMVFTILAVLRRLRHHHSIVATVVVGFVCISTVISVAVAQWPLRVSYAFAKRHLDTMADKMHAGDTLPMPHRAGLLLIQSAELSNRGIVCLWTRTHPNGNSGFVQCGPDNIPFNLWSVVKLDPVWQFISED